MTLFVLDTDVSSLLLHGNVEVAQRIVNLASADIATTIVKVEELLSGWYTQLRRAKDDTRLVRAYAGLSGVVRFINTVKVLPFNDRSAENRRQLQASKLRIGANDIKIASIVLAFPDAVLVTRNIRDFSQVPGLAVEVWT